MSLDNIHLSPLLVKHLYKKVLITEPSQMEEPIQTITPMIPSLGTNKKNICILVNEPNAGFLPEDDMILLTGILTACQLSVADVAIINSAKCKELNFEQLKTNFNPQLLILFGISPADLAFPLQFPKYQLQKYDHKSFVYSSPLHVLSEDVDQKKQLWSCLQKHFYNN